MTARKATAISAFDFVDWSVKHMKRYVSEFTFRLNDGNVQVETKDRIACLTRLAFNKQFTYAILTEPVK